MTQNNNASTVAPATSQIPTPAVQPAIMQPVKGDAAKVMTAEKK